MGLGLGAGFGVVLDVLVLRVFVRAARDAAGGATIAYTLEASLG